ncbi:MAG: FAD-dependent oxidoreductase [Candidatus Gracilibacteria bacterium]|nr:FAD-dependent oxidoreductase [Candidatus Gracilibacteria bacterium]
MHDLIIIGAGSAGLPAGMYASRYRLKNCIIGTMPGGALATSHKVENYPGTLSASGREIMDRFTEHAVSAGSELIQDEVMDVSKNDGIFTVETASGKIFESRFVLLAIGNKYRKLGVPGEEKFLGAGVSYCATCDGMFFRNRTVALVGGGNTAITEALYLAELCKEVHILVRGSEFRAETVWIDQLAKHANIHVHFNTSVASIEGGFGVEKLIMTDGSELAVDGIFVAIGNEPNTAIIDAFSPEKDNAGYIVVDKRQQTSVPGLYAAGDITTGSNKFQQTIMSAAEGCLAAHSIHEDILKGDVH